MRGIRDLVYFFMYLCLRLVSVLLAGDGNGDRRLGRRSVVIRTVLGRTAIFDGLVVCFLFGPSFTFLPPFLKVK